MSGSYSDDSYYCISSLCNEEQTKLKSSKIKGCDIISIMLLVIESKGREI
jgi:hypothetical protein